VLAAVRRGTIWDTLGSAVALFGVSFPSFWLGIMLILLFSEVFHLLPPSGLSEYGREAELSARVRHAILPTLTLGLIQMASFMRFTRSSLLEVLRQDYVRTARAKGLGGGRVVWRHALRNALIPVVTVVGLSLPTLVGGAVLTETVFAWPGIGRLAVGAVFERDYPVIMGVNLMVAAVVISANLVTDLAYCVIDPRISYRCRRARNGRRSSGGSRATVGAWSAAWSSRSWSPPARWRRCWRRRATPRSRC